MRLCSWSGAPLLLLGLLLHTALAVERHYYIAAVHINWTYTAQDGQSSGPTYKKVVFREYDAGFKQAKAHPPWLGLLGPTLRGQKGDVIKVTFRNMADRPYSLHPHGIAYVKQSEGSLYFDNTSLFEKEDDEVSPGEEHTYTWEVTDEVAPTEEDPPCLTYTYISHYDIVKDYNSGLIGTLLVCKEGSLSDTGEQLLFSQEYVLLFGVFDEGESWYTTGSVPTDSRIKYTINGYMNGSIPDLKVCAYTSVSWHLLGMSSEPEVFSVHFNGQVMLHAGHKVSTVGLISGSSTGANMTTAHPGRWLLSSIVSGHMEAGMHGYLNIEECEGILPPRRRITMKQRRQSQEWTYYIAAEEVIWDYAPTMAEYIDSDYKSKYLKSGPDRIGQKYKKAVFTQYTDETFTERAENKQRKMETGILGPVIRAQIRDIVKIVFKNKASRPFSIYPHGLTIDKMEEGFSYPDRGNQTNGVQPGQTHTYEWKVIEEDEPTDSDSRCLTRMYHSAVDPARDIASGLVGPLLICKSQSLDKRNAQLKADKEQHAMLIVFDENKSWYIDENIKSFCGDPSRVTKEDPEFYKSNVMHSINGYVYDSGQVLGFCNGEIVTWHMSSVGAQDHIQTATFYGHSFELNDRAEDLLSLFPMTGETINMNMDNIGHWLLASLSSHETQKGESNSSSEEEMPSSTDSKEEVIIYLKNNSKEVTLTSSLDHQKEHWSYNGNHQLVPMETKNARNESEPNLDNLKVRQGGKEKQSQGGRKPHGSRVKRKRAFKPRSRSMNSGVPEFSPRGARPMSSEELKSKSIVIVVPRRDFNDYELYIPNLSEESESVDIPNEGFEDTYEYVDYKDPYSQQGDIKDIDETTKYYLKMAGDNVKPYFIAAEEVEWDYAGYGQRRQERTNIDESQTKFTKVVFRSYLDSSFSTADIRGEIDEHLGILGPIIKAEVDQTIMVVFRNLASRPYSLHAHGVSYTKQMEGLKYDDESPYWYKHDNEVQPKQTYTYIWKVDPKIGPKPHESDCRTWAYYSGVNPEKDINSGLIGPLLVCKKGTLAKHSENMREFVLLFMTFDETKSWYYEKNVELMQRKSKKAAVDHQLTKNLKFPAINGIVFSLKGLRMYTNQLVRWHLFNMGSQKDLHSIHFHGQTFLDKRIMDYRQGIYPLLPGGFATLEMWPSKPGLWQLESTVGGVQQRGMQTLFLVIDNSCGHPLGLVSQSVKDSQITASHYTGEWKPHLARLYNTGKYNAWSTEKNTANWIQVDFKRPVVISKVATQGAKQFFTSHYVMNYTISYSTDRRKWTFYKGNSNFFRMSFTGNQDSHDVKENTFFPPLIGRFIRLHPHNSYNRPTVRLEYYGCELDGCSVPLGMESGRIKDEQITASSTASSWFVGPWQPWFARLNKQGAVNAWQAKTNNMQQWLQVELKEVMKITGIVTQGAKSLGTEMYVTEYTIEYSKNGKTWTKYKEDEHDPEPQVFPGNSDNNGHMKNYIYPPIFARFIKIIPRRWQSTITMRIELLGCDFK
ncbi:hypothetical protein MATL_G00149280 [Megalops atlanticus]|uniref:ferroxidase n=1 Tax=Megalops atlanticus TaxID=7932 RepID=A0A9D3PU31_MEGAT|nr:hypothetical protein MATL_G00149280 [Megalops atlanticus]